MNTSSEQTPGRTTPPPVPKPTPVLDIIDERTGLREFVKRVISYPVRGGASWGHTLGVALVVLFVVQCITGTLLATYYSPSITDAWASVAYIQLFVAGGGMVRGIHHFATGAMVILAGLHMAYVVVVGAYKAPREANWWVGFALFGLVLAYPLTGYTLLWDQLGFWASKVRTGITGTVPILGPYLQALAISGNDHGNLTLTRTYALHTVVLPAITAGLILLHIILFVRKGYTPRLENEPSGLDESYGSVQLFYDLVLSGLIVGAVAILAAMFGAPLRAPADPTANFLARPEWYFLPLFQLLKYFTGPLQAVGTVVVPGLVATFLLALPLLDRGPTRRLSARRRWVGGFFALALIMGSLASLAVREDMLDPGFSDHHNFAERESERALTLARDGVPPEGAAKMMSRDPLTRGERVFRQRCRSCHALEGFKPKEPKGPDLTAYGSKAWLRQLLRDPDGPRFFGHTEKVDGMPSFAKVPDEELNQVVDMLVALRTTEGVATEDLPIDQALLTKLECADCHDFEEDYAVEGPSLVGFQSAAWIRAMIDNPGAEHLYGEMNEMPAFSAKLSEFDRSALVTFIQSLESRASQDVWPYVDEPAPTPRPKSEKTASKNKAH